jgi:hypothetical protein
MVKQSAVLSCVLAFSLLTINISNISFAQDSCQQPSSDADSLTQNTVKRLLTVFEKNNVEIRDSIDLDESLSKLDCSDTDVRKLHPKAWFKPMIKAREDELVLLWKNNRYMLVPGGENLEYQPIYNTHEKFKFTLASLERSPKSFRNQTFLVVKEDSLAAVTYNGKTIILKPGFHWLKKGEHDFKFINVGQWLLETNDCVSMDNKEVSPPACIQRKEFAGVTLERVAPDSHNTIRLYTSNDGAWRILKPGINIYAAGLAPIDPTVSIQRQYYFKIDPLNIASSGSDVLVSFTLAAPSNKEFSDLAHKHEDGRSYAQYLLDLNKNYYRLGQRVAKNFTKAVALHIDAIDSDEELDLQLFHKNIQYTLEHMIEQIRDRKELFDYVELKQAVITIDTATKRAHQNEIGMIKRQHEIKVLKRQDDEDKIKSTNLEYERQEKLLDNQHKRDIEKLRIKTEHKTSGAQRDKANAEAQTAKEKRKKLEFKQTNKKQ